MSGLLWNISILPISGESAALCLQELKAVTKPLSKGEVVCTETKTATASWAQNSKHKHIAFAKWWVNRSPNTGAESCEETDGRWCVQSVHTQTTMVQPRYSAAVLWQRSNCQQQQQSGKKQQLDLKMSLTSLPLLPLEAIASNLDFSSLVNLSKTNSSLAHLQPKEQHIVGQDFSLSGPSDGDFCPDTYFDVEVLTRGLVAVKMVWEWRDQVQFHFSRSTYFFLFLTFEYTSLTFRAMATKRVSCGCS